MQGPGNAAGFDTLGHASSRLMAGCGNVKWIRREIWNTRKFGLPKSSGDVSSSRLMNANIALSSGATTPKLVDATVDSEWTSLGCGNECVMGSQKH